jgi:beta-galactosidase
MLRRDFFKAPMLAAFPFAAAEDAIPQPSIEESLVGRWRFRIDSEKRWREVVVPHTWNTMPEFSGYQGAAWYERTFYAPAGWKGRNIRIEFEAVFHTAEVWINGTRVGEHKGKGYTAFEFDITSSVKPGAENSVRVKVDNSFADDMLPRGKSYDWTMDGGVYRPVKLIVSPAVHLSNLAVDAVPDLVSGAASLNIDARTNGGGDRSAVRYAIFEEESGLLVASGSGLGKVEIRSPRLWHFDHPHLYRLSAWIGGHLLETIFGIRKIETRDGGLFLNGERVRLHGVERMAGSHPVHGMAEPAGWIEHDHNDLKELNCLITRVHWQQDRRVLDYCDRHGILIQVEIPTWGGDTWKGMKEEPSAAVMQNGLEQLREMIARDRNHPSVFAWGLCNEVGGQGPVARIFVRRMKEEARRLDPNRLLTYASNSLQTMPEKDVAGELDFISWNEYYESWYKGTAENVRENLSVIERAFPGKMIVISEYGYCECTADRVGGDGKRVEILREHNRIFREFPNIGGLIFFCYNDYRTHIGDKGEGVAKQRVHGVVDLFGARKPSFAALRHESSPVESLELRGEAVTIRTRSTMPCYRLSGYTLRWIVYGFGDLPMEQGEHSLRDLSPGESQEVEARIKTRDARRIVYEVIRPTGFSAFTQTRVFPGGD